MTIENTNPPASGGSNQNPGGNPDQKPGGDGTPGAKDAVSYETHRTLLSEKKRIAEENAALKARLDAAEKAIKDAEEAKLREQGEYKKIAENREKEALELKAKLDAQAKVFDDAKKYEAFSRALGQSLQPQYLRLVDLDGIAIDPTTQRVDDGTVAKAVEQFRATYPEVLGSRKGSLPAGAPAGSGGGLTYEAWLQLPHDEMVKRRKEIVETK